MRRLSVLPLLFSLSGFAAGDPPVYVNKNSVDAALAMEKIAGVDPSILSSEADLTEWARARLAWIALRRLQGRETEALQLFLGCGSTCGKFGAEKEWKAVKAWGCGKKKGAKPCK